MKAIFLSLLIFITLLGCNNTNCPSFPDYLENYYPYKKGDIIDFTNQNGDTLHLTISDNWVTRDYSFKWNCKCACEASAGFNSELESNFHLRIHGGMSLFPDENRSEIAIEFFNDQIYSDVFTLIVENLNPFKSDNSKIFGDSISIKMQENSRISSILVVKGTGLVEFFDKSQDCTWTKVE